MEEVEKARKNAEKLAKRELKLNDDEEEKDALGNTIKKEKKLETLELSKAERKKLMKRRKDMVKNGEDTYELDIQLGI